MSFPPTLAVLDARMMTVEEAVSKLTGLAEQQTKFNGEMTTALRLLQQAHDHDHDRMEKEVVPDVRRLMSERGNVQGGWAVVKFLGGILVGGASVVGVVWSLTH